MGENNGFEIKVGGVNEFPFCVRRARLMSIFGFENVFEEGKEVVCKGCGVLLAWIGNC